MPEYNGVLLDDQQTGRRLLKAQLLRHDLFKALGQGWPGRSQACAANRLQAGNSWIYGQQDPNQAQQQRPA
ncbi:MAG: hypothetical protein CVV27_03265 [Candidatus Melainabacteria bacterium HGW-Melainabacteria-1]|nr:MAG: hypothetical protein CVV27_03265 [Candidatus Melainabacteria bacterium HGW-Melainabacteria-1]